SILLCLAPVFTALLTFAAPQKVEAQYRGYPNPPAYTPYQTMQDMPDIGGIWYMPGREDRPCQVIPSRQGDRALFINEKGDRAGGFLRGNRIFVPAWGNLQGRFLGDTIQWSNGSWWYR